jgi:hypothetical protein
MVQERYIAANIHVRPKAMGRDTLFPDMMLIIVRAHILVVNLRILAIQHKARIATLTDSDALCAEVGGAW